jgi:uncharacterized protein YyaL (SSP411 family)
VRRLSQLVLLSLCLASPARGADGGEPIAWLGWSDATFQYARGLARPVLLYLEASGSGRCRAFEASVWADLEVRRKIAGGFVAIRVDRDRRPDIYSRYERGGAPSVAFLLPSGNALFFHDAKGLLRSGAAEFTPEQMRRYLDMVLRVYRADPEGLERAAEKAFQEILKLRKPTGKPLTLEMIGAAADGVLRAADPIHGGLSGRTRRALAAPVHAALEQAERTGDNDLALFASHTLDAMARSPLRDPLSGAFRAETRRADWTEAAPERLLQTQGEMLRLYLQAYRLLGAPEYRAVAEGVCEALLRDFYLPELHSLRASVAPAAGAGDPEQLSLADLAPLPKRLRPAVVAWLGLDPGGARGEPRTARTAGEVAASLGISLPRSETWIEEAAKGLRAARSEVGDDTVLTGATAEAAGALLEAAVVLGRPEAAGAARAVLAYLDAEIYSAVDGAVHGMEVRPARPIPVFLLADQVALGEAWLTAYEVGGDAEARARVEQIAELIRARFLDPATAALSDRRLQPGDVGDLRIPDRQLGENARAAQFLLRVGALKPGLAGAEVARGILESLADEFTSYGAEAAEFGRAVFRALNEPMRILIVDAGHGAPDPRAGSLRRAAVSAPLVWRSIVTARPEEDSGILRGARITDLTTAAYLLRPEGVRGPFRNEAELTAALAEWRAAAAPREAGTR